MNELSNLKKLDKGRKSTIYKLKENKVLKLYDKGFPKEKVIQEFANANEVYKSRRILTPSPIEISNIKDQSGIVFEYIKGDSLMNLMMKNPFKYLQISKEVAQLHRTVHKINCRLITQEEKYTKVIKVSKKFDKDAKKELVKILYKKHKQSLCHGDFHQGNILKTKSNKYYILDWDSSFVGSYKLDVALTAVNGMVSDSPKHIPKIFQILYEILKRIMKLDKRYLKLYGIKEKEISEYMYLASAIHLIQCEGSDREHRKQFERYKRLSYSEY